jgi:SpoVK/Ycf46/Vps4 family AAA+-type ATPase
MSTFTGGYGLESTLCTYGVTGNPVIDSLILAQLIPILFAYWTTVTNVFKRFLYYLLKLTITYIKTNYISKSNDTKLVFFTDIKKSNTLFYNFIIHNIIMNNELKSDKNSIQFMDIINSFMNNDKKDKNTSSNNYYDFEFGGYGGYCNTTYESKKWRAEYDLHLNEENNNISYTKSFRRLDVKEDICKTFVDDENNLIIKFGLLGKDTADSKIEINIFQLKHDENIKQFKLSMFENFMNKRFDMKCKIPVIQTINITNRSILIQISNFIKENIGNTISSQTDAKMNCGNTELITFANFENTTNIDKESESKDNKNNKFSQISISCKNNIDIVFDETVENYNNKLKYDVYSSNKNEDNHSFNTLYSKYIDYTSNLTNKLGSYKYGYFYHNNRIIMIYNDTWQNMYKIKIISENEYAPFEELTDLINNILTGRISNNKKIKNKTEKTPVLIFKRVDGKWNNYELDIRSFDTIYLPNDVMKEISLEFEEFSEMKQLYKFIQIPYRKGILFYGPPGTGKTSLTKALAYEHQMSIYIVNVNDSDVNDDTITNILSSIGKSGSKILLFEDVDSAFSDKEMVKNEVKTNVSNSGQNTIQVELKTDTTSNDVKNKKSTPPPMLNYNNRQTENNIDNIQQNNKYLTYSGLLNALDGVLSGHEGVITVMTTNYIDKLGAAFLRPGRIDRKFLLTYCNDEQIYKMASNFIEKRLTIMQNGMKSDSEAKTFETVHLDSNKKYIDFDYKDAKIREFVQTVMDSGQKYTPSQMQQYFIKNIKKIDNIFENVNCITNAFDYKCKSSPN